MTMTRWIAPVTLTGQNAVLRPMREDDAEALSTAARDGELWKLWYTMVASPETMKENIAAALERRAALGEMPFVVETIAGEVIGSTRYINVDEANARLEIGNTWYAKRVQRTAVNTECKLMLLGHAFESLGAIAVEFRTHWHNKASQSASGQVSTQRRVLTGALRYT